MPEALQTVLAMPGIVWVLIATLISGLVYGFAGFGSALIVMPVAAQFVPVEMAIAAFSLSALASLFTVVPGAWKVAERREVGELILACVLVTPLGVWLLKVVPATSIQLALSITVLVTLAALIFGLRFQAKPGVATRMAVGGAAGITGGATGLNGPVVILFNLSSGAQSQQVRANTALFLTTTSLTFLPQLWLQDLLSAEALWLGAVMLVFYWVGTVFGVRAFSPGREVLYRRVAYALIACAGLAGLPIWGAG